MSQTERHSTSSSTGDMLNQLHHVFSRQAPALVNDLSHSGFADIVKLSDVHALLEGFDLPPSLVDLAQNSKPLPKAMYTRGGELDRRAVARLHSEGATIILRAAHRWISGLRDLCASTEAHFAAPAQANIYLTPPRNQSTPPHWDTHDLFILQIAGSKNWRLFDAPYELPLEDQRYDQDQFGLGDLREEVVLDVGDALYLPRGAVHEPRSLTYSAHVALGVHVMRRADVLTAVVDFLARETPELREMVRFPPHACSDLDIEAAANELHDLLSKVDWRSSARAGLIGQLEILISQRLQPSTRDFATTPAAFDAEIGHALAPHAYLAVHRTSDRINLSWEGGGVTVPGSFEPLVTAITSAHQFTLRDIDVDDRQSAAALVESLVLEGVLEPVTLKAESEVQSSSHFGDDSQPITANAPLLA